MEGYVFSHFVVAVGINSDWMMYPGKGAQATRGDTRKSQLAPVFAYSYPVYFPTNARSTPS